MVSNKKATGRAMSTPAGLAIGLAASISVTLLCAAMVTYLVLSENMSENTIGYWVMAILIVSSALGSLIASTMIKRRWMVMCLGAGGMYFLSLLAITALFFGGQYQGIGVTALMILSGSGAVGLLGLRQGKSSSFKHKKYRSR